MVVSVVSDGEMKQMAEFLKSGAQLASLERAIVHKLASMSGSLAEESDIENLKAVADVMDALLASLGRLRKIRKT